MQGEGAPESVGLELGDGAGGEGVSPRALVPMLSRLGFILEVVGTLD